MDNFLINKRIKEGIHKNPNKTIGNLSQVELNSEEIPLSKPDPKHGRLVGTNKNDMIIIMENIYD